MGILKRMAGAGLKTGEVLAAMGRAQANWELEMSRVILGRRWKLLLVALLPVLLGVGMEMATAASLPGYIGGDKAYMPSFVTTSMFVGSIFVGIMAGLITGVIGAGGGYVLTPALMSIGVKGIMAVGTDQFHLFAKAIMGTVIHRKMGNVNFWIAVWFVLGSVTGASVGGVLNRSIYQKSPALSDAFISSVYVIMLGILGAYALMDWVRARKSSGADASGQATITSFARWLQSLPLKPRVRFDEDMVPGGRSLAVYPIIICGFIVGFVASIMGVGGGFLTFPMFVYGLGVSTFTTVGTDILQIIFTTGYSSIVQYAAYGYVFYSVAMGMLLGSLVGVQLGALVTKMVKGATIRAFYALTILAGFVNRICALPGKLNSVGWINLNASAAAIINSVGTVIFFALVGIFSLWILVAFFKGAGRIREAERAALAGSGSVGAGH
ncbi:TSUP family transporter [Desulfofundulus thermobenzoicus]|uniref:Probable membrane transporter protein n=1 Tax=Desulfofundulus thermobenzoicus TaxID=29376 RepID=A0A6N7ISR3_9FIRM|nr:sulfite exporter TauE/SafE family protein [Desulfofundulus thermobenzoicus]MQL53090.1 TSUP family transporter [Desulfofundulus thermobenzoicus]HHW42589.1 sulfite exporter TauE/SafE family protein [Desulfotomaculum sp.]